MTAREALLTLERLRSATGGAAAAQKRACLAVLARRSLRGARAVERLHEALCFLRAYPDEAGVLAAVERALETFEARVRRLTPRARARLHLQDLSATRRPGSRAPVDPAGRGRGEWNGDGAAGRGRGTLALAPARAA